MGIMTDGITLFTVPAGTWIEEVEGGKWLFCEPGKTPYTINIIAGPSWFEVIKTSIHPNCKTELTIGVTS